jgi:hypothetical protein
MADQMLNILDGIASRLATYTASGQTLEDIKSYLVKYDKNELPPEFGSLPPILLVEGLTQESQIISIPASDSRKIFPVRFQIFVEHADYDEDHKAASLLDLVETVFFQQQLGISNLLVDISSKIYGIAGRSEFAVMMEGGAEMIITYQYTDTRAMP